MRSKVRLVRMLSLSLVYYIQFNSLRDDPLLPLIDHQLLSMHSNKRADACSLTCKESGKNFAFLFFEFLNSRTFKLFMQAAGSLKNNKKCPLITSIRLKRRMRKEKFSQNTSKRHFVRE